MDLADHTWPDVGEQLGSASTAIVPLGSTEQHGPHLPLATDHLIAEALATAAADETGLPRTPTVDIGVSPHHRQFPGTLWVDPPQFRDYVESFTRNLAYHGIDRVVYVNAHGGNVSHLREVGRRLHQAEEMYAIEWMWDESIPELVDDLFAQNGPHAGPKETAMITHIAPDLVRPEEFEAARDGGLRRLRDDGPRRAHLLRRGRQLSERRVRRPDRRHAGESRTAVRGGRRPARSAPGMARRPRDRGVVAGAAGGVRIRVRIGSVRRTHTDNKDARQRRRCYETADAEGSR